MKPGSLSTASGTARWNSLSAAAGWRALAGCAAVGAIAGVLAAHVRLGLGMPGHKALFWMAPILAARLLYGHPVGATAGACSAAVTSLALGGNLAGGALFLPLVAAAGALLDAAAAFAKRHGLSAVWVLLLFAATGTGANLLCALKRMLVPQKAYHTLLGLTGATAQLACYALFGLAAGLAGAAIALAGARLPKRRADNRQRAGE